MPEPQFMGESASEDELDELFSGQAIASLKTTVRDVSKVSADMDRSARDGSTKSTKSLGSASSGGDSPLMSTAFLAEQAGKPNGANYQHFGTIDATLKKPGWLSVFLKYMMLGDRPEHLLMYLYLSWFRKSPTEELATELCMIFMSPSSPLLPSEEALPGLNDDSDGLHNGTMLELQTMLEAKPVNLGHVRTLLDDAFTALQEDLNARLGDMVMLFRDNGTLAKSCGAIGEKSPLMIDWADQSKTREAQHSEERKLMMTLLTPFVVDMAKSRQNVSTPFDEQQLPVYNQNLTQCLIAVMTKLDLDTSHLQGAAFGHRGTIAKQKKSKVHMYHGHPFVLHSYLAPSFCEHCDKLLWGLSKQGWQCALCGMNLHKKKTSSCCHDLSKPCPGAKPGEIKKMNKSQLAAAAAGAHADSGEEDDSDSDDDEQGGGKERTRGSVYTSKELPRDPAKEAKVFAELISKDQSKMMKSMFGKGKESKRQELLYELIQTEKGYIRHLAIVKRLFKQQFSLPAGRKILNKQNTTTMFGNIEQLIDVHKLISEALTKLQADAIAVGNGSLPTLGQDFLDLFREKVTSQLYNAYCVNLSAARELCAEMMKTSPEFKARIAETEAMSECTRLRLSDFIMKPNQRLTKYPLLFRDIREALVPYSCLPGKDDKAGRMTESEKRAEMDVLQELEDICVTNLKTVNQSVADWEDMQQLKSINQNFKDTDGKTGSHGCLTDAEVEFMSDLHVGRQLILDGEVSLMHKVIGEKKNSKQKVRLMMLTDMLLIMEKTTVGKGKDAIHTYKPMALGGRTGYTPMVMLGAMVLKANPSGGGKNGFFVLTTQKYTLDGSMGVPQLMEFEAETKIGCQKWKDAIVKTSQQYQKAHPTWMADLEETARNKRATKSSTISGSMSKQFSDFSESNKDMGRRSSLMSSSRGNRSAQQKIKSVGSAKGKEPPSPNRASSPLKQGSGGASEALDAEEVQAELNEANGKIGELERNVQKLQGQLQHVQAQVRPAEQQVHDLRAQNATLLAENERLKKQLQFMEEQASHDFNDRSPPPLNRINHDRSGSYIAKSQKYAAPTEAPPPPPPGGAGNRTRTDSAQSFEGFGGFADSDGRPSLTLQSPYKEAPSSHKDSVDSSC